MDTLQQLHWKTTYDSHAYAAIFRLASIQLDLTKAETQILYLWMNDGAAWSQEAEDPILSTKRL